MLTNGPWKIISSSKKYFNNWMKVREDEVIRPDGSKGIFGVVELLPGVSVLPIDERGVAYLTKEFRYAIKDYSIEAASGGKDEDESFLEAAKRELEEELGIVGTQWDELSMVNPLTSILYAPQHLFLVRNLSYTKTNREVTEQIEEIKLPFNTLVDMAISGEITHAPTVSLLLKAKIFLEEESKN